MPQIYCPASIKTHLFAHSDENQLVLPPCVPYKQVLINYQSALWLLILILCLYSRCKSTFSNSSNKSLKRNHEENCLAALSWVVNAGSEMFNTVSWRMRTGRNIREKSKSAGEHITQRTEQCCAARQLLPKKLVEQSTSERGAGFLCCCWWGGGGVLITWRREEGKHLHQLHSSLHTGTEKADATYFRFDSGCYCCYRYCCY